MRPTNLPPKENFHIAIRKYLKGDFGDDKIALKQIRLRTMYKIFGSVSSINRSRQFDNYDTYLRYVSEGPENVHYDEAIENLSNYLRQTGFMYPNLRNLEDGSKLIHLNEKYFLNGGEVRYKKLKYSFPRTTPDPRFIEMGDNKITIKRKSTNMELLKIVKKSNSVKVDALFKFVLPSRISVSTTSAAGEEKDILYNLYGAYQKKVADMLEECKDSALSEISKDVRYHLEFDGGTASGDEIVLTQHSQLVDEIVESVLEKDIYSARNFEGK